MTTAAPSYAAFSGDWTPEEITAQLAQFTSCLHRLQAELRGLKSSLAATLAETGAIHGAEVIFMLKNKFGMSKDEAKNLFFKFRGSSSEPESNPSKMAAPEPQGTDEKIAVILDYMKDTSVKLEKIENDIEFLKEQIDRILKQL